MEVETRRKDRAIKSEAMAMLLTLQNLPLQAQNFAHRPGLERTTSRGVGRLGVGDFGT